MVMLVKEKLQRDSVDQYKIEERSIVAKRILSSGNRIKRLINIGKADEISNPENIAALGKQIHELTRDIAFKKSKTMWEILSAALDFVRRNYENVSMNQIIGNRV